MLRRSCFQCSDYDLIVGDGSQADAKFSPGEDIDGATCNPDYADFLGKRMSILWATCVGAFSNRVSHSDESQVNSDETESVHDLDGEGEGMK